MTIGTTIKARRANYLYYLIKLPEEEMLSRFFHCQWLTENQFDWTRQVKCDLADLGLPADLEIIQKKSEFGWKALVKKRAREYELKKLLEIKEEKSKSKMKNLGYDELKPQDYLKNLDVKEAKNVFRFRVKMATWNGNFKGLGPPDLCPLCGKHEDVQEMSFKCPKVLEEIEISDGYMNIFENNISQKLAKTLSKILELRRKEEETCP